MSNTIGFSNFRRFADFPEIDLGDITILVGGNNSGKSTIVKALLLCVDNLLLMRINDRGRTESRSPMVLLNPVFRFDASEYHDVKIKEFSRAIHNKPVEDKDIMATIKKTKKKSLPTVITFKFTLGQFHFTFNVSGNRDERSTTGNVDRIVIEDTKSHVRYTNNYSSRTMDYEVLNTEFEEQLTLTKKLLQDYRSAKNALDKATEDGDLEAITSLTASLDKVKMQINSMLNRDREGEELSEEELVNVLKDSLIKKRETKAEYWDIPLSVSRNEVNEHVVLNVISNIRNFATTKGRAPKAERMSPDFYVSAMEEFAMLEKHREAMKQDENIFNQSYRDLNTLLKQIKIEYISAHAANQNTIYNTADLNDYIAQTVHGFWREKISSGDREYEFVREWMQRFDIGIDFKIDALVPGEAYTVSITEESGSVVPLADKGMGSIQIMILLLRLATIMFKYKPNRMQDFYDWTSPIIVIEEPEQNLHPKMQSYLADLFYHLARYESLKMLIETHSEYLIRKSQVIVAAEQFADEDDLDNNNLFSVYYLPNDDTAPYKMKYRTDGKFSNEFGEGFFDEANKLLFDIL